MHPRAAALVLGIATLGATIRAHAPAERVVPNDNRAGAGALRNGVLTLRLDARPGAWHPDGDAAPGATVPAFAEAGRAPRIPGPLVRVPAGTTVSLTLRNDLVDTLRVHGLHDRGAPADTAPIVLAPGASRGMRFRLDAPGTYHYWGTTTRRALEFRTREDAQLTGAIVVDPRGAPARARDRVFVVGMWTDTVARANTERKRLLAVINGRSWPHTERIDQVVGDTVRWRVINASADLHPMHLHGFYFRVDARGDGRVDTTYAPSLADSVVTEGLYPGATMQLTWVPERAGNWVFHCHIPEHFARRGSLGMPRPASPGERPGHAHAVANHALDAMGGLVLGIRVRPRTVARDAVNAAEPPAGARRRLRLLVRPNAGGTAGMPLYGYALHEGAGPPPPGDSGLRYGPPIELARGEPVSIMVVNGLADPTSVHWHGIELESYYDGVAGFGGSGGRVTPAIAPGDSFEARFTPPRAGTFIYHTHVDEERQQLGGLAGPLLVLEPGHRRDPATDLPVLITSPDPATDRPPRVLVNGRLTPAPLVLRAGVPHRLRFINMTMRRAALHVELRRGDARIDWRPLAKDGADYPAARRGAVPAIRMVSIGETYDVEVTPDAPGDLRIEIRPAVRAGPRPLFGTVPVTVVP